MEVVDAAAMHLSFGLQATKSRRVKNSGAITLKRAAMIIAANLMLVVVAFIP
jgi:hypothetical protein